MQQLKIASATS